MKQKLQIALILCYFLIPFGVSAQILEFEHSTKPHEGIKPDTFKLTPMKLEERQKIVPDYGISSLYPAIEWQDGLPSGNGEHGVLVFGSPYNEELVFNHEKLFRPMFDKRPVTPDISSALPEIRRLMKLNRYDDALTYSLKVAAENGHTEIINTPPFHPAFSLFITHPKKVNPNKYLRTLDFMTGEITVRWQDEKGDWSRKTFVSRKDNVVVQLIECNEGKTPFDAKIWLHGITNSKIKVDSKWLTFRYKYKKTERGYESATRLIHEGGNEVIGDSTVTFKNTRRIILLTRINYLEDRQSKMNELKTSLTALPANYLQLLKRHTAIHTEVMERVSFKLNFGNKSNRYLSTEELLLKQKHSKEILPALLEKMFYMGRYALYSSSGHYPPNLGGVWNGYWKPYWSSDFTLDTNLNIQTAGVNIGNMKEALQSYLNLIEEIAPTWEVNAKKIYGCRGYLSSARTSGRENYLTHFNTWPGHFWTAGAAWLISTLHDYYLVSGDQKFLHKHLLPLMEKSVLFYEDFLTEYDENGKFLFAPSYSPENRGPSVNAVMDIAAAKEVITNLVGIYEELNIKPEKVTKLKNMLTKFPPYLINKDGALKEWATPNIPDNYNQRHMAHSYPVWPAHEISPESDPKLFQAMRVALEKRGPGDFSAHGFVVKSYCAARTKHEAILYRNLLFLLQNDFILRGLLTDHYSFRIPCTDMLISLPTIVMEALIYSKPGLIELLPATSEKFRKGSIQGIRCRTQATIESLEWDYDTNTLFVSINSLKDQWVDLVVRKGIRKIETEADIKNSTFGDKGRKILLKKDVSTKIKIVFGES